MDVTNSWLLDTGPLVALVNKKDSYHQQAKTIFQKISGTFITCEAVISEACFLMRDITLGPREIIILGMKGFYTIPYSFSHEFKLLFEIFNKYDDQSISLADACLIRMAEVYNQPKIITFDSDFERYRFGKRKKFEIVK